MSSHDHSPDAPRFRRKDLDEALAQPSPDAAREPEPAPPQLAQGADGTAGAPARSFFQRADASQPLANAEIAAAPEPASAEPDSPEMAEPSEPVNETPAIFRRADSAFRRADAPTNEPIPQPSEPVPTDAVNAEAPTLAAEALPDAPTTTAAEPTSVDEPASTLPRIGLRASDVTPASELAPEPALESGLTSEPASLAPESLAEPQAPQSDAPPIAAFAPAPEPPTLETPTFAVELVSEPTSTADDAPIAALPVEEAPVSETPSETPNDAPSAAAAELSTAPEITAPQAQAEAPPEILATEASPATDSPATDITAVDTTPSELTAAHSPEPDGTATAEIVEEDTFDPFAALALPPWPEDPAPTTEPAAISDTPAEPQAGAETQALTEPEAEATHEVAMELTPDTATEPAVEAESGAAPEVPVEAPIEPAAETSPVTVAEPSAEAPTELPTELPAESPTEPVTETMPDPIAQTLTETPAEPLAESPTEPAFDAAPDAGAEAPADMPAASDAAPTELTLEQVMAMMASEGSDAGGGGESWGTTPLTLPPEKLELLQFMITDLRGGAEQIEPIIAEIADITTRAEAAASMRDLADGMRKTAEFFEFASLNTLIDLLHRVGLRIADVQDDNLNEVLLRVRAVKRLIDQHASALEVMMETSWPLHTLSERIDSLLSGMPMDPAFVAWHRNDIDRVLELDRVVEGVEPLPEPGSAPIAPVDNSAAATTQTASTQASTTDPASAEKAIPIVRVDERLLEQLFDLVGQLVLSKNRLSRVTRMLQSARDTRDSIEELVVTASELDRLTSSLQTGIMQTRLQPIGKLFERYPRVIRDVARLADKEIEIELHGQDILVDKGLIESLSDPLTQLLRHAASHSIEAPADREARGKPRSGRVTLSATHQGTHVVITLHDDGSGIDPAALRAKAVELGIVPEADAAAMREAQLMELCFNEDMGVGMLAGMDQKLRKFNAEPAISSEPGVSCTITVSVPLAAAIIPSMLVGVGPSMYAIPLKAVVEILKPGAEHRSEMGGRPLIRLREQVLPVVNLRESLNESAPEGVPEGELPRFAVVVDNAGHRAALLVDRVVGQQEIVLKQLDERCAVEGPFSGATIRDDGSVSLILDIARVLRDLSTEAVA